jgi:hypothetical protein
MSKYRKAAQGEHCTIRLPGCLPGTETSVLAHLPNRSIGMKNNDLNSAIACYSCHQIADGAVQTDLEKEWVELMFRRGQERTINRMIEKGVLKV